MVSAENYITEVWVGGRGKGWEEGGGRKTSKMEKLEHGGERVSCFSVHTLTDMLHQF